MPGQSARDALYSNPHFEAQEFQLSKPRIHTGRHICTASKLGKIDALTSTQFSGEPFHERN